MKEPKLYNVNPAGKRSIKVTRPLLGKTVYRFETVVKKLPIRKVLS